jgi:hypothetical protein
MLTKLTSPSREYPTVESLATRVIGDLRADSSGWWHLELNAAGSAIRRALLRGYQPWIELAVSREGKHLLNLGRQARRALDIPAGWVAGGKGEFTIPGSELSGLASWIGEFFQQASGNETRTVTAEYRE